MRVLAAILAFAFLAHGAAALPVEKVLIRTHGGVRIFRMEIAADDASRATGLMRRGRLAQNAGMLFDFHQPVMASFWMKDTILPLDMLFVRADGTISTVAANAVPLSTAAIVAAEPVRAVIEINGGLAKIFGIAPGDRVQASIFRKASGR